MVSGKRFIGGRWIELGKVKITQAQEEEIKRIVYKDTAVMEYVNGTEVGKLEKLSLDDFIKALYIGYEVEPDFEVGDYVTHVDTGEVGIVYGSKENLRVTCEGGYYDSIRFFRYATPEEIAAEKERRLFARNGRKPWELKQGDILTKTIDGFPVIVSPHKKDLLYDFGIDGLRKQYRVACFVDDREDWEND